MFKNYFKTAIRNLNRNKSYAFINVLGLTVGIAACLLIFIVIQFENSFDNFHKKKAHTYRVVSIFNGADGIGYSSGVPFPVARTLRIDHPELKKVAGIFGNGNSLVAVTQDNGEVKKFRERNVLF